jgi:two-component system, sensor histidine kinase and response regulator
MVSGADEVAAERVLILTPTGRDAEMVCARIVADGMTGEICPDARALLASISTGAGAAIIAQEALSSNDSAGLLAALEAQEPWSDIPVLLLLPEPRRKRPRVAAPASVLYERANVTLLQRPLGLRLFSSSLRAAVRGRRRQYKMRDLHLELERSVQLSDMFVSILGHDLRDPLGAIRLAAELIMQLCPDTAAHRPASRIVTSADRMTRMIEQLLDFARARQGGGIPLSLGPAQLEEICREVLQELGDAQRPATLRLHREGDPSGVWDADRLAQVVTNLVGNALQHGRPGEPVVVEVDGNSPSTVRLRVSNSGTIAPETVPLLFDAFKRAVPHAATGKTGLGLGLFIAREIVLAHGGEIAAASVNDRTIFEVSLPREACPVDTGALSTT